MIAFSAAQLAAIHEAAALLPSGHDNFFRSVANRLADITPISDYDVHAAIRFVLSAYGISTPSYRSIGVRHAPQTISARR